MAKQYSFPIILNFEEQLPVPGPSKAALNSRAYRERKREENLTYDKTARERAKRSYERRKIASQTNTSIMSNAEKCRLYRQRKKSKQAITVVNNDNIKIDSKNYNNATQQFNKDFYENPLGHVCDVCDRIWFAKDLKCITSLPEQDLLKKEFPNQVGFKVCSTCHTSIKKMKIPILSKSNGFAFVSIPDNLPVLNLIEERLVSPRIPFMQIRRLRFAAGNYGIIGQIVNVPIDVQQTINLLPRNLENDTTLNVQIKRKIFHKSSYLEGYITMDKVYAWLEYLVTTPLYRANCIKIEKLQKSNIQFNIELETVEANDCETEYLTAQQHTLLWDEEKELDIKREDKCF